MGTNLLPGPRLPSAQFNITSYQLISSCKKNIKIYNNWAQNSSLLSCRNTICINIIIPTRPTLDGTETHLTWKVRQILFSSFPCCLSQSSLIALSSTTILILKGTRIFFSCPHHHYHPRSPPTLPATQQQQQPSQTPHLLTMEIIQTVSRAQKEPQGRHLDTIYK